MLQCEFYVKKDIRMNTKKLIEMLKYIKRMKYTGLISMWELVKSGEAKVIRKRWYDSFKQDHPDICPLDLGNIETWRTYNNCIDYDFYLKNKRLFCDVVIWDGDNYYGRRTFQKIIATLSLPIEQINLIETGLEVKFKYKLEDEYQDYLEKQKKKWVNKRSKEILK